jgi:hypothetical protein
MFFNHWRFPANLVLLSSALILSSILPQSAFSQFGGGGKQSPNTEEVQALKAKVKAEQLQMQKQLEKLLAEKQKMIQALQEAHS